MGTINMKALAIVFSCFLMFIAISGNVLAAEKDNYGRITQLQGHAFAVYQEKTFTLKKGYQIPFGTEIMTEEGAKVSLMDFYKREYRISGGGHITVTRHGVKLSRGHLWIKSSNRDQKLYIKSANSVAEMLAGEGIFSFDGISGKSQLLSIKGEFKLAHFLDVNRYEIVRPGEFSVVDPEMVSPRNATPIGFSSYEKIIALFREEGSGVRSRKYSSRNLASLSHFQAKELTPQQVEGVRRGLRKLAMKKRKKIISHEGNTPRSEVQFQAGSHGKKNKVVTRIFNLKKLPKNLENEESSVPVSPSPPPSPAKVIKADPRGAQNRMLHQRRRWKEEGKSVSDNRYPASIPASVSAPDSESFSRSSAWGLNKNLKRYLQKTSRQKLLDEGLLEDLKNYRLGYKTNH